MHADLNERVVVATQTTPWLATADGEGVCKPLDSLEAGAGTTSRGAHRGQVLHNHIPLNQ